ncbi:cytochrome P450 [Aspergillus pseudotamarii]|uniref:Cytochrome P450 n=1 Tax=Aspergillus pseudotamarii TaxID=132259 RepID=A0A5N6T4U0_ASPPS|nr:cytochrome P450 [Aspergillus pseudotamarii]KAE8141328.1 cytochrome P450 [Aspergillus pseudotamarii]
MTEQAHFPSQPQTWFHSHLTLEGQYILVLLQNLETAIWAILAFTTFVLISQVHYRAQLAKLPSFDIDGGNEIWRRAYLESARKLYQEGYKKFKDQACVMPTSDVFPTAINKVLEVKYTKVAPNEPLVPYCIKADLNPALSRLNPIIYREVGNTLKDEIPGCEDWTPVLIYQELVNTVAKVSGRIFVGAGLFLNKDYLDTAINYTIELGNAVQVVKEMKPWLRPCLAWRPSEVQQLNQREELAVHSIRCLVRMQLLVIFAGIHSATVTATNVLYNLAVSPGYMQPPREEIRTAISDNDGTLTSRALQQMEKLDSFMKETIRFYPPELTPFSRQTVQGTTLSSGQYIPPGTSIETPLQAIYQADNNYPDSDTFDGFRFYKIRQGEAQLSMLAINLHACPGRFLAAAEIEMILSRILLDYYFKNADNRTERYPNYDVGRLVSSPSSPPMQENEGIRQPSVDAGSQYAGTTTFWSWFDPLSKDSSGHLVDCETNR